MRVFAVCYTDSVHACIEHKEAHREKALSSHLIIERLGLGDWQSKEPHVHVPSLSLSLSFSLCCVCVCARALECVCPVCACVALCPVCMCLSHNSCTWALMTCAFSDKIVWRTMTPHEASPPSLIRERATHQIPTLGNLIFFSPFSHFLGCFSSSSSLLWHPISRPQHTDHRRHSMLLFPPRNAIIGAYFKKSTSTANGEHTVN